MKSSADRMATDDADADVDVDDKAKSVKLRDNAVARDFINATIDGASLFFAVVVCCLLLLNVLFTLQLN